MSMTRDTPPWSPHIDEGHGTVVVNVSAFSRTLRTGTCQAEDADHQGSRCPPLRSFTSRKLG